MGIDVSLALRSGFVCPISMFEAGGPFLGFASTLAGFRAGVSTEPILMFEAGGAALGLGVTVAGFRAGFAADPIWIFEAGAR